MAQGLLPSGTTIPVLQVGTDARGSACWLIVADDMAIPCASGARALEIYRAVCRSKGVRPPQ